MMKLNKIKVQEAARGGQTFLHSEGTGTELHFDKDLRVIYVKEASQPTVQVIPLENIVWMELSQLEKPKKV